MKNIGLLFCLFLSLHLVAQKSGFDFGVEVNTGFSDRFYPGDGSSFADSKREYLREKKKSLFAFRVAVNAEHFLSEKVSLLSGIGFSRSGITFKGSPPPSSDVGFTIMTNAIDGSYPDDLLLIPTQRNEPYKEFNYHLEIPVLLNYYLQENQNGFFLSGGVSPLYNLKTGKSAVKNRYYCRRMNFNAEIGFGYRAALNEKLSLSIVPNFQMQILEQSKNDGGLNRRLYFAGIAVRVR